MEPPQAPALTPADVALLADQVAALAVAGLPSPRIWAAVAEHGPSAAARAVGAVVVAQTRRGVPPGRALRTHLQADPGAPCPAAVQLAVALDVSERTGAGTAPTLHRFAEALRADERAAQERAAALAGPQTTAAVLAVLPLAGLALGALLGSRPWHALLATSVGRVSLLAGSLLWFVGRRWTAHLVRRAVASS
jgi:tight adherence protein B